MTRTAERRRGVAKPLQPTPKTVPAMPATPAHSIVPAGTGLLDIAAAAQLLNIPEGALRKSVSARRVPHTRLGKHVRFAPHHIEAIVAAGEQEIVAPPRTTSATGRSRL